MLGGVEEDIKVEEGHAMLTNPDEAKDFVTKTGCDSLACAIGTSHGAFKFKGRQSLHFDVLEKIKARLPGFPLVMHGSSSVPQDEVQRINAAGGQIKDSMGVDPKEYLPAAKLGVTKVNIDTDGQRSTDARAPASFSATSPANSTSAPGEDLHRGIRQVHCQPATNCSAPPTSSRTCARASASKRRINFFLQCAALRAAHFGRMDMTSLCVVVGGLKPALSEISCSPAWLLATGLPALRADDAAVKPGATFESLVVGKNTYLHVKVLSISPHTIMIAHASGMTSVHLRDLSPEWQARFGYNPAEEPPSLSTPVPLAAPSRPAPAPTAALSAAHEVASRFVYLGKQFGVPAEIKSEVDLRPLFFQLELNIKNQGRRPSCSVFAIVSALEFQNAQLTGHPEKFSEEYLIWAARKLTKRTAPSLKNADQAVQENFDEGFSLSEVIEAIHVYGVPLQQSLPNTFGRKMEDIEDPPEAVINEARTHQKVFAFVLPGRDPATRLNNLVQSLNAGIPVTVGVSWPMFRSMHNAYLGGQTPMKDKAHAVTISRLQVTSTGRIEDAYFIFKNSYGVEWGQGGYGTASYKYLTNYLYDAVLLEVLLKAKAFRVGGEQYWRSRSSRSGRGHVGRRALPRT